VTIQPDARHTEYLALDDLRENPANPKEHDEALMGDSVSRFGFIEPIVMDERTGFLISGHGRREALLRMRAGGGFPPNGVMTTEAGDWMVPVVRGWGSSSDAEAAAALAALNRVGERGGWNDLDLLALLRNVAESEQGLVGVGFSETDLTVLQRLAEAEAVYTTGVESMVDEFRHVTGQDAPDYERVYEAKVTVYLRDQQAIADFKAALKLDDLATVVNFPTDWVPDDRRRFHDNRDAD
jgi:hypothetical protein